MHCSSASLLAHTYMYCGESRVGSESRNVMVGSMVDFAAGRGGARAGGRDLQKWSVSLSVYPSTGSLAQSSAKQYCTDHQ